MSSTVIFATNAVLGYVAWLLCFRAYLWPRLKRVSPLEAQSAIAMIHSFRFFGLVVLLPGVVGMHLPARLAGIAGYSDLATSVLAILALLTVRVRALFRWLVVAFNLVGVAGLVLTYIYAVRVNLPALAGELGAAFVVPVLYVPLQMITHVAALYLLLRAQPAATGAFPAEGIHHA